MSSGSEQPITSLVSSGVGAGPRGAAATRDAGRTRRTVASAAGSARPSRAAGDRRRRGRPEPVGPVAQRLGQHLLHGRGALDGLQLARLPLRLARPRRADDRRQATGRALGPGAVGADLRLLELVAARPRGGDGDPRRAARLRPRPRPLRPRRRDRGGADARADPDHGRDVASQQPGRAADPQLRRRAVVRRPRACATVRATCAGCCVGCGRWRIGVGFETKMSVALFVVPGIALAWLWVDPARARVACGAGPAARRRRRCWPWSASPGRCSCG